MTDTEHRAPHVTPPRAGRSMRTRAAWAVGVVCLLFVLLVGRLAQMQVIDAAHYKELARSQQHVTHTLTARRGEILDRRGRLLATSADVFSAFVDPKFVLDPAATATALSYALDVDASRLAARIARPRRFVWVKRHLTHGETEAVKALHLPGVFLRREFKRMYPQGYLGAQVIGFTDIDGRGLAGVEREADRPLTGRPGEEEVPLDGARRVMRDPRKIICREPQDGCDVYLALDLEVQLIAEQELQTAMDIHKPAAGLAVVMDPRDGSVLAIACRPTFKPHDPSATPVANQRNTAVTDAYEYGSVMKPIIAALALESGAVKPDTVIFCHNGAWRVGSAGRVVRDAGSHAFGDLTVAEIIVHSSNIGAAFIGRALGLDAMYDGMIKFGFDVPSGIALPGEIGGIVLPKERWNKIHSVISVSFGQEVAVTPLGLVRAYAALANGGELLEPRIIERVVDPATGETLYEAPERVVTRRVVSERTAAQVMDMMHRVVEEGTGRNAKLDYYTVAGKTGTAQMIDPARRGYGDKYLSSFTAVAPVEEPRIVVLVSLKAPTVGGHYGGTVAAPAVRNIVRRTLEYMQVPKKRIDRTAQSGGGDDHD